MPARFPVTASEPGSKLAMDVSARLHRSGASATGVRSAASACASNFTVAWIGTTTSCCHLGSTASSSTGRCTTTSIVLFCSRPDTANVALPGATAVNTPVRLTRATPGSLEVHWRASGLMTRRFWVGTMTRTVSDSPGPSVMGPDSPKAKSVCCTTTGAVAVSPLALVI